MMDEILTEPQLLGWMQSLGFVVSSTAVAWLVSGWAADRWSGSWRVRAMVPALMALWTVAVVLRFGCTVPAMAGALYGILAVSASYADLRCREVDDYIHLMLLLVGLLGTQPQQVPAMALAAVVVSLPLLVVALCHCPLGGADVKYTAAFGFGVGVVDGMAGLLLGLVLAIVHQSVLKKREPGFPLIPYLSGAYLLVYFVRGGV